MSPPTTTIDHKRLVDPKITLGHIATTLMLLVILIGALISGVRLIEQNAEATRLNRQSIETIQDNRHYTRQKLNRIESKIDEVNRFLRNRRYDGGT